MRAGRMDNKIIIQQSTTTQDSYNQPIDSWSTYATLWAEVIYPKGREYLAGNVPIAEQPILFRTWYKSGVTRKMRVSYDSIYWDIQSVSVVGRNEGLEIVAKAVVE